MHSGYAATGSKVHAVDSDSSRNRLAQQQGWMDVKTGAPYAEALCGAVVVTGEAKWVNLEGVSCKRCARKVDTARPVS